MLYARCAFGGPPKHEPPHSSSRFISSLRFSPPLDVVIGHPAAAGFTAQKELFLPGLLPGAEGLFVALVLLVLSFALIFAGRSVIKALAFLALGLAGAVFGSAAGALVLGIVGVILGFFVGFFLGGILGILVVQLAMGLALGYFAYLVTFDVIHVPLVAVIVGVVLALVGTIIAFILLELVTAILGGVILYGVLTYFGLPALASAVVSVVLALVGFYVQHARTTRRGRRRLGNRPDYPT